MRSGARPTRSLRGVLTVVAMFVVGVAVLWGLFQAPRPKAPASPELPWGTPSRVLRFVTLDCTDDAGALLTVGQIVEAVRPLEPDFVLFQRVRSEDAVPLAAALGMRRSYHPQFFRALGTRPRGPVGCLILSKHPLYDAAPVREPGDDAATFGVRAVSAVGDVRFAILSARPRGAAAAGDAPGSSPAVAGAAFAVGSTTGNARRGNLASWHAASEGGRGAILLRGQWTGRGGGAVKVGTTGQEAVWAELVGDAPASRQSR